MKTIREVLEAAKPRRLAEDLLGFLLKLKRIELYMQIDRPLMEQELQTLRSLWKRAQKGEPVEYITGEVEFLDCRIEVDPRVLIPRPETEILADLIVKRAPSGQLWDLCCGSGCLGIALKKKIPSLEVTLSDLSFDALAVAQKNAEKNQVAVSFMQGDLLAPFLGRKADVVICNPPYISEEEYEQLDVSVKGFEPRLALVGGRKGTEMYERLARDLPPFLHPGAQVFFEIGFAQGEELKKIFNEPVWASRTLEKDWSGKDRFFFLEKQ
jgi:release factor glutamine methyltransferase